MATTRRLSAEDFKACVAAPMRDVTALVEVPADIWREVGALDPTVFAFPM